MRCVVKGCEAEAKKRGWCNKHYMRWRTHGDAEKRSRYDLNEIVVGKTFCRMRLYDRQGREIATTLFDKEDLPKIQGRKWGLDGRRYVRSGTHGPKLHQVVMGCKGIDHRSGDKLDNRKSNLRKATQAQNCCNQKRRVDNKSGFKGVCWCENRWLAQINFKGKHYCLGRFKDKVDAIAAYSKAAQKLHGQFARTAQEKRK